MTHIAAVIRDGGGHMRRMLTRHDSAVVTGGALTGHCRTVVKARTQPSRRIEVTTLAWRTGNNMLVGFGCRQNPLTHRVASFAIARSAFEYSTNMTGFTRRSSMPAQQRKARRHVIKITAARACFSSRIHRKK